MATLQKLQAYADNNRPTVEEVKNAFLDEWTLVTLLGPLDRAALHLHLMIDARPAAYVAYWLIGKIQGVVDYEDYPSGTVVDIWEWASAKWLAPLYQEDKVKSTL